MGVFGSRDSHDVAPRLGGRAVEPATKAVRPSPWSRGRCWSSSFFSVLANSGPRAFDRLANCSLFPSRRSTRCAHTRADGGTEAWAERWLSPVDCSRWAWPDWSPSHRWRGSGPSPWWGRSSSDGWVSLVWLRSVPTHVRERPDWSCTRRCRCRTPRSRQDDRRFSSRTHSFRGLCISPDACRGSAVRSSAIRFCAATT